MATDQDAYRQQEERKERLDKLAKYNVHAYSTLTGAGHAPCGGILSVAWGGYYCRYEYVLRCAKCGILEDNAPLVKRETPYDVWKQGGAVPVWTANAYERKEEERLMKEHGSNSVKALQKYGNRTDLTVTMAEEIVESLWPKAPREEKVRAALLCASERLNPLLKHVYLVPFNEGKQNESWATILSIKAKRLLASRRGVYSYIDDTPRVMTAEEQKKRFGEVKEGLQVIVKLCDPATKAEVVGFGEWPKGKAVYGSDKGNNPFNMASIRAESMALDRLRPGELPTAITMDETEAEAINAEYRVLTSEVDQQTGEIKTTPEAVKPPEQASATPGLVVDLTKLEFTTPLDLFAAANTYFNLSKVQVQKEAAMYDLSVAGQRKQAWLAIVSVYQTKEG